MNKKISIRFLFILFWVSYVHTANAGEGENVLSEEIKTTLTSESYIYVATRRLNGEWSTAAPVWFMYDGETVYFSTSPSSHKAHRIHRGSPVRIWVGRKDGPAFEGETQLVKDRETVERMSEAYKQKYWIAGRDVGKPVMQMREYLRVLRLIMEKAAQGGEIDFQGECYQIHARNFFSRSTPQPSARPANSRIIIGTNCSRHFPTIT